MKRQNRRTPAVVRIMDETLCFSKAQLKREMRRAKKTIEWVAGYSIGPEQFMTVALADETVGPVTPNG